MKLMIRKVLLLIFIIIFFLCLPVLAKEKLTQQKIDNIKAILELSNYKETVRVTWENMFQQIIKVQHFQFTKCFKFFYFHMIESNQWFFDGF